MHIVGWADETVAHVVLEKTWERDYIFKLEILSKMFILSVYINGVIIR